MSEHETTWQAQRDQWAADYAAYAAAHDLPEAIPVDNPEDTAIDWDKVWTEAGLR